MMVSFFDPFILFFALGFFSGVFKSDLKLPQALYETLSIYLLLAIGLKGGMALEGAEVGKHVLQLSSAVMLGLILPMLAYVIFRKIGKFNVYDSSSVAAHYGSVSAITFAVVISFLEQKEVTYEAFAPVLLVLMEIPAILLGIALVRWHISVGKIPFKKLLHDVFLGKSIYLLIGGFLIGYATESRFIEPIKSFFITPFKSVLLFFLLEMGIIASSRIEDLKKNGIFLIAFGILFPLVASVIGAIIGKLVGFSLGGTVILATLSASASYIAAPAAFRIAVPQANTSISIASALGITFPFNIMIGIPIYYMFVQFLFK